jgi:hypothetical protein
MKPQDVKQRNKQQIIATLSGKRLRWTDLLEKSRLSRRALALHLKEMEGKTVKRTVDSTAKEYPPPVYYELIPGNIDPADLFLGELNLEILDFLDVFALEYNLLLAQKETRKEKIDANAVGNIIEKAKQSMLEMYKAHKLIGKVLS